MKCETLHLKEIYPFLGGDGRDAVLDCYLPYNMPEMHREAQKRKTPVSYTHLTLPTT